MERRVHHFDSEPQQPTVSLSLQERVLAAGMLDQNKSNTVNYEFDTDGVKKVNPISVDRFPQLSEKFRQNPKDILAMGRMNLLAIEADKNQTKNERDERIDRYLPAFLDLQIKLDKLAYPPDDMVRNFVPSYIPDNLTDMGQDDRVNPKERSSREKIRVGKKEIFERANNFLSTIYKENTKDLDSTQWKTYVTKQVAMFVHTSMPYNRGFRMPSSIFSRSINAAEIMDKRLAVCRHHALVSQVLLQSFGLTSRLLKCDLNLGSDSKFFPHAANLVRIDHQWYLLDTTNPDLEDGLKTVFLKPIPEKEIDLNTKKYEWQFDVRQGAKQYIYRSRNNMYFKISKD